MYWEKNTTFDATADRKTESDSEKPNNCEVEPLTCDGNCWMKKQNGEWLCEHCQREPKTEPEVRSNLEPFRVDEPQTDYRITGAIGYRCPKCGRGNFLNNETSCVYCGEPLIKNEPQTDCAWAAPDEPRTVPLYPMTEGDD